MIASTPLIALQDASSSKTQQNIKTEQEILEEKKKRGMKIAKISLAIIFICVLLRGGLAYFAEVQNNKPRQKIEYKALFT